MEYSQSPVFASVGEADSTTPCTTAKPLVIQASLETYREALAMNNAAVSLFKHGNSGKALKLQRDALTTLQESFAKPLQGPQHTTKQMVQQFPMMHYFRHNTLHPIHPEAPWMDTRLPNHAVCPSSDDANTFYSIHPVEENDAVSLATAVVQSDCPSMQMALLFPIYMRISPTMEQGLEETSLLVARQSSIIFYNHGILEYLVYLQWGSKTRLHTALKSLKLASETYLRLLVQRCTKVCCGTTDKESLVFLAALALNALKSVCWSHRDVYAVEAERVQQMTLFLQQHMDDQQYFGQLYAPREIAAVAA